MTVIKLRGSPSEIGYGHGSAASGLIQRIGEDNRRSLELLARRRGGASVSRGALDQRLDELVPFVKEHTPELWSETEAIAESAGVSAHDVLGLNAFLDLHDLTFPDFQSTLHAPGCCTSVALRDDDKALTFVGQNYDVRDFFGDGAIVLDLQPQAAPRALVATIAGMVGCAGINEAGIAVVINNLTPLDSGLGVTHAYIVRKILEAETMTQAINAVVSLPRSSGFNYLLADGNGEIVGLETSARSVVPYFANHAGFACHANHFVDPALVPGEVPDVRNGDTLARYARAQHLLPGTLRAADVLGSCKGLLSDHANYPTSICRHIPESAEKSDAEWQLVQGRTVFSVIAEPRRRALWYCEGNPCEGEWTELTF